MQDPLRIMIVDDEPEAREVLNYMLQKEEGLQVVGMAGHVDRAMELLDREQPDLVFLDIQMPEKDGFNFIHLVNNAGYQPAIIFVTAYENYAIQAIRNSVFDYILKPVRREELMQAIDRYRKSTGREQKRDLNLLIEALRSSAPDKVKFNTRSGYILINPSDVVYCKAEGNYTLIQLVNGNTELTTQNLGTIESLLGAASFFRVSRSYLVNLRFLSRVDRKNSHCILEYPGRSFTIKIPSQKIKILESSFT